MWQKCPICNGTGTTWFPFPFGNGTSAACPTCKGHNIINELTGLPPNTTNPLVIKDNSTTLTKTPTGDFRDDMCSEGK